MADAARRKERKRLKREKKRAQMRRVMAGSPYKRVGQVGEIEACYINADWQSGGLASIHVVRQNPGGGMALGCFLIDLWCAGLKDVWGSLDMASDDIADHIARTKEQFELVRIEPEAARHLVAGSIRFARQNGFKLPAHFDRWINFLGGVPSPARADLRSFGKDGGLLWVGPMDDLRRRLIGCSVDQFLARPGVHFVTEIEDFGEDEFADEDFDDDAEDDLEAEMDGLGEEFEAMVEPIVREATEKCRKLGEQPSELMTDAVRTILLSAAIRSVATEGDASEKETVRGIIKSADESAGADIPEDLKQAIRQVLRVLPDGPESWDP
jgi:hypothetical protein